MSSLHETPAPDKTPVLTLLFGSECGSIPTPKEWRPLIEDTAPDYVFAHVARVGRRKLRVCWWLAASLALAGVPYLRVELRGGRRIQARYVWLRDAFQTGREVVDDGWRFLEFDASLLHEFAKPIRREVTRR